LTQHGIKEHSHGNVPIQTRSERPRSASVSDFPDVSKLQEIWRYIPEDKLRGLDAEVMGEVSESEIELRLASGVTSRIVDSTDAIVGTAGLPEDRVSAAAWTNASKTLVIEVAKDAEIAEPSFIKLNLNSEDTKALHVVISVGNFASATIVLHQHSGLGEGLEPYLQPNLPPWQRLKPEACCCDPGRRPGSSNSSKLPIQHRCHHQHVWCLPSRHRQLL
jgi:Fe-S cluster assembly protein SufD